MTEEKQQEQNNDDFDYHGVVKQAEQAAAKLEEQNLRFEENLKRMEAARVRETLSGESTVEEPTKEDSDADYAAKALRGDL